MQQSKSILLPFILVLLVAVSHSRILQLTHKNLPNVLKSQSKILSLYHHPECPYSQSYLPKFTSLHNAASGSSTDETVGMIDCSQEKILCQNHQVNNYPTLGWVSDAGVSKVEPYIYLAQSGQYQGDQYLSTYIAKLIRQEPYWVVVLFEEQGMPVPEQYKPKQHKYYNRVFYLSEGRVAQTLAGFVNNKPGCWVFRKPENRTDTLQRISCGQTYQSKSQLSQFLASLSSGSALTPQESLLDKSNHTDETVIGYKQLRYWLEHHSLHLQMSTHSKISMCSYLYLWSPNCQHCDSESDLKILKRGIDKKYKGLNKKVNKNKEMEKQERNEKQVFYKKKIHTYDVSNNDIGFMNQLQNLVGVKVDNQEIGEYFIVPNLVALCFATYDNWNQDTATLLAFYKLDKIITINNVENFVQTVIRSQEKYATNQSANRTQKNEEKQRTEL